jgi:hypothetical protein
MNACLSDAMLASVARTFMLGGDATVHEPQGTS